MVIDRLQIRDAVPEAFFEKRVLQGLKSVQSLVNVHFQKHQNQVFRVFGQLLPVNTVFIELSRIYLVYQILAVIILERELPDQQIIHYYPTAPQVAFYIIIDSSEEFGSEIKERPAQVFYFFVRLIHNFTEPEIY